MSHKNLLSFLLLLICNLITTNDSIIFANAAKTQAKTIKEYLSMGDEALMANNIPQAISLYQEGTQLIQMETKSEEQNTITSSSYIATAISIYTNLGTAYSILAEQSPKNQILYQPKTIQTYRDAIILHQQYSNHPKTTSSDNKNVNKVAAQTSFFLGMEYQDTNDFEQAMTSYGLAYTLDPLHWSAVANMAALIVDYNDFITNDKKNDSPMIKAYQDPAVRSEEALMAYNKAYEILSSTTEEPTDYPSNPNYMLSQLQYTMGMILTDTPSHRTCQIMSEKHEQQTVDCHQMAIHAFNQAVERDDTNEPAKHMLAALTADATVVRASNPYVTELFEKYAKNFEHSLVDELGYNGYERLRRGFDRAFGGQEKVPSFSLVVDAGCGTGLVGEQFRNVSEHLIGADLSPSILQEAQKLRPNLYDDTYVGDVMELFQSFDKSPIKPKKISLIVAADSYIYFGDLIPLFESMSMGLYRSVSDPNKNGLIAFTLENVDYESEKSLTQTAPNWRWQLTPSGRFAHRKEYVEYVASLYNLETVYYEPMDGFRYEKGIPVRGHLFVMRAIGNVFKAEL